MASTKAPSGLSIARDSLKFTFSWKKGDSDYNEGQQVEWKTNLDTKYTALSVSTSATSKAVSLTASTYFPTTNKKLTSVTFRVRGKRAATTKNNVTTYYDWSAWTEKAFSVKVPARPTVTTSTTSNRTTFTWETEAETNDSRPYVNTLYQNMLIHNCNETDGSKLRWASSQSGWQEATGTMSSSVTKTEDSTTLAGGSYTRWFRIKSRGAAGESAWRYAKHVYARPYAAKIKSVGSAESDENTTVRAEWTATSDAAHPIDKTTVQYVFATPASGFSCPSGASWQDAGYIYDTSGTDALRFTVSEQVQEDQCLWVRVANTHDDNTIYSDAEVVRAARLAAPTNLTISNINTSTYKATVTATNNSAVPDSKLAVIFRMGGKRWTVGVINVHGGNSGSVTVQCPSFASANLIGFTVYAFQGDYTSATKNGVTTYTIDANMTSTALGDNSTIPKAPSAVTVNATKNLTEAIVHWRWTWTDADQAEISWSDRSTAWESSNPPNTFIVETDEVSKWRVCDLEPGKTYYFRVRLGKTTEDGVTWGPYSDTETCGFYSAPDKPALQLSAATVKTNMTFTASWTYSSKDEIKQGGAEVCAFPVDSAPAESTWGKLVIATAKSGQAVNIKAADWTPGTTYELHVRVTSKKDMASAWSDAVTIHVPAVLTCAISATSLTTMSISDSDGGTRSVTALRALPLTLTVTGAPAGGTTTVIIEREDEYHMIRPDETMFDGYAGETIAIYRQTGSAAISITKDDLIGHLDDGAKYILTAIVSADNAISASVSRRFEVHWSTQAKVPNASTIEFLDNAVKITPSATSPATGTTCDIYRLSADRPELIIRDGSFGTAYVDPYPAIGDKGGYRVVYKTAAGDYITSTNLPAWTDTEAGLDTRSNIIDFNGEQVLLNYNMDLSHGWTKSFIETKYLGGSVQGDWNLNVSRTANVAAATVVTREPETIDALRRLAVWTGICHVRTVDGSSFAADVQVNETRSYKHAGGMAEFALTITRVDNQTLDGIPYSEWS